VKVLYRGKLYVIEELVGGDTLVLRGDDDEVLRLSCGDPDVIVDPTDLDLVEAGLLADWRKDKT